MLGQGDLVLNMQIPQQHLVLPLTALSLTNKKEKEKTMIEQNNQEQLTPKEIRQIEVDSYLLNINTYTALLATLDGDWDADLIHLKGIEAQEAARQCPMDRLERLAVLQQFDQVTNLLKTEIVEYNKAKAILDIL
jgi:hypothetical protein